MSNDTVQVPREPTPEMLHALRTGSFRDYPSDELCRVRYAAAIAAAPQEQPAPQMPIARLKVLNGLEVTATLYAPGLPDGEHDLFCAPCSPNGQWAPSIFAAEQQEQPAEPVNQQLLDALRKLTNDVTDLINDSGGVYGLHLNGDLASWDELTEGGRYEEWLLGPTDTRAAIAAAEQIEEIKRLADECMKEARWVGVVAQTHGGESDLHRANWKASDARLALHAALDALRGSQRGQAASSAVTSAARSS